MREQARHNRMAAEVPGVLAGMLGAEPDEVDVRREDPSGTGSVVYAVSHAFAVEFKMTASAAVVAKAAHQALQHASHLRRKAVPLVAVPFMGEVGRRVCEDSGVAWLDLSGNAHIVAKGLRVVVDGRPNRFRSAGRPANLFAPKSSRVVRWMLIHPGRAFRQRELAQATGVDEGFVSRIVRRLEREQYVIRDEDSAVRPRDNDLLLDAWREAYEFERHTVHRGHVAARSGDALLKSACKAFAGQGVDYAATGLAAAWVLTHFAAFRTATIYLTAEPSRAVLEKLGFRSDPKGANLWLVVPNDEGVFHGSAAKNGIRCVHPVQAYLDLKAHPERADGAAERLRGDMLIWSRDA